MQITDRTLYIITSFLSLFYVAAVSFIEPSDLHFLPMSVQVLHPDSAGYLNFSSVRTLGYPLFLKSILFSMEDYSGLALVQAAVYSCACLILLHALRKSGLSKTWSILLWACILLNPIIFAYHYAVLTDSFFYSHVVFITSLIVMIWRTPKNIWLWISLGVALGIMVTIRPATLAFFPILGVLWLFLARQGQHVFRLTLCSLLLAVGFFMLEKNAHSIVHANENSTLLTKHMAAKAGLVAGLTEAAVLPDISIFKPQADRLQLEMRPFSAFKSNWINSCTNESLGFAEVYTQYQYDYSFVPKNLHMEFALAVLKNNTQAWLSLVTCHYFGSWALMGARNPMLAAEKKEIMSQISDAAKIVNPALYDSIPKHWKLERPPVRIAEFIFPTFMVGVTITFVLMMWGLKKALFRQVQKMSPLLGAAVTLTFLVHGYFLFIAIFNIASQRYTVAMIAPIGCIIVVLIDLALKKFLKQRS